jgi:phosphoenolpyruvate carboxylase
MAAPAPAQDPFYEQTDLIWDFYRAMRAWHEALCADPDYAVLLNSFAASFLSPAGSRPSKRPDASAGPRGMRAIPHNALLQQLAAPLNVACGVGASAAPEAERLIALANASPRFKGLLELAVRARLLTSMPVLRGYASVYSPDIWIALSKAAPDSKAACYEGVALQFRDYSVFTAIQRVANHVALDLSAFDRVIAHVDGAPSPSERHQQRLDVHILHVFRQALMMRAMAVAMRTPAFSDRHDSSFDDLFQLVAQMRLGEASRLLSEIFPASGEGDDPVASAWVGEPASAQARTHGYDDIRRDILAEIDKVNAALKVISLSLCSAYGACG